MNPTQSFAANCVKRNMSRKDQMSDRIRSQFIEFLETDNKELRAKLVKLEAVAKAANMVINHDDDCGDIWIPELRKSLQKLRETK